MVFFLFNYLVLSHIDNYFIFTTCRKGPFLSRKLACNIIIYCIHIRLIILLYCYLDPLGILLLNSHQPCSSLSLFFVCYFSCVASEVEFELFLQATSLQSIINMTIILMMPIWYIYHSLYEPSSHILLLCNNQSQKSVNHSALIYDSCFIKKFLCIPWASSWTVFLNTLMCLETFSVNLNLCVFVMVCYCFLEAANISYDLWFTKDYFE